jgi:hypothetical protein
MLSNSQKEHLTYTAIGQVFILVALGIFSYQYIIPGLSEIGVLSKNTQVNIDAYKSTYENGVSFAELWNLLGKKPEYAELVKIIQSDKDHAPKVILKTNMSITGGTSNDYNCISVDYYTCLKNVLGRADADRASIETEKKKLNSIIPTMSPISWTIEEDNLTLRQYVKFIESSVLKSFNFDSNVLIGMQWVTFGNRANGMPENIGTFQFQLDFKWTNADIAKFIDYINTAWKPDILSQTGLAIPSVMSNPLITMESFSIQNKLDLDNPNGANSGRAALKFYVRWISKDDITFLKENVKARQASLQGRIDDSVKQCQKDAIICSSKKLLAFQQKYLEYTRALWSVKIAVSGNDEIYALSQNVNTLRSLEAEFETIVPKIKK